jgi:tRNA (guanine37-N1)-methyltransferase
MHFTLLTLFPEMFPGVLAHSLAGKALEKGLWSYEAINIRDFATDKHGTVDDTPYGGGAGMVMKADVLGAAIEFAIQSSVDRVQSSDSCHSRENGNPAEVATHEINNISDWIPASTGMKDGLPSTINRQPPTKLIYPSPRGKLLTQAKVNELVEHKNLTILCGRYEGVDERVLQKYNIEEVSLGDYILSGGEIAAFTILDACIRKINGVLGNPETHSQESFEGEFANLLEYPLYTRPAVWQGLEVPEVLQSGNHKLIAEWRKAQSEAITKARRPDLIKQVISGSDSVSK